MGNAPIKENISDISEYEVIYIMSPIYWGTDAPELFRTDSQLEQFKKWAPNFEKDTH